MNATSDTTSDRLDERLASLVKAVNELVEQLRDADCDRLLNARETSALVGISKATLYRLVKAGKLPQPIKVSDGLSFWKRSTIVAFIDNLE